MVPERVPETAVPYAQVKMVNLEPVSGFEPLTCRLQDHGGGSKR